MTYAEWVDEAAGPVVRPYAVVGGRTQATDGRFNLVAFISTLVESVHGWTGIQPEHVAILELCRTPRAVTEVAARLDLPVGVVRVLLGDLASLNAILVREPPAPNSRPSIGLIREVLNGLRAL
ncbi:DUF742 domain-containing protein [Streptomyces sp. NPDC051664]|uniref:DUF742 domain-containing protein n=1 Tax=Streptomyces sp. NPDC051664 TaxID=3365668 RepID=UPI00378A86CD